MSVADETGFLIAGGSLYRLTHRRIWSRETLLLPLDGSKRADRRVVPLPDIFVLQVREPIEKVLDMHTTPI